ncbi:unnamed protein product [Chrysoparadoxa australica]
MAMAYAKRTYGPKTRCGNYIEQMLDPLTPQESGFPHKTYESDQQAGMREGTGIKVKKFGAGIPPKGNDKLNYANVIGYDKTSTERNWNTMTAATYGTGAGKKSEFTSTFKLNKGEMDENTLKEYRARWTVESDAMRKLRFQTDIQISANEGTTKQYHSSKTRQLPGAPLAVERLREQITINGSTGLQNVRRHLRLMDGSGDGKLQAEELREGLRQLGIYPSDADFEKVVQYFDRNGDGIISSAEFCRGVRGKMSAEREAVVNAVFDKLDITGDGAIDADDIKRIYNVADHPDVVSGMKLPEEVYESFLQQWDNGTRDGTVTFAEFADYCLDLGATISDDDHFRVIMETCWGL